MMYLRVDEDGPTHNSYHDEIKNIFKIYSKLNKNILLNTYLEKLNEHSIFYSSSLFVIV